MHNPFETPQYLEKFGLKEPPYTTNPDERYLFLTETHQEAINMCGRLIQNREGAGLVIGDHGTGKTTIMRRLTSLMMDAGDFNVAVIETAEHCPSVFQLVKEILESFGQECVGRDTKSRVDQFKQFLFDSYKEEKACILFIDEAQQMKGNLLESLRGLLNFEDAAAGGKLLQIILLAMPSIRRKLRYAPSFSNRLVKTDLMRMERGGNGKHAGVEIYPSRWTTFPLRPSLARRVVQALKRQSTYHLRNRPSSAGDSGSHRKSNHAADHPRSIGTQNHELAK